VTVTVSDPVLHSGQVVCSAASSTGRAYEGATEPTGQHRVCVPQQIVSAAAVRLVLHLYASFSAPGQGQLQENTELNSRVRWTGGKAMPSNHYVQQIANFGGQLQALQRNSQPHHNTGGSSSSCARISMCPSG